MKTTLSLSSLLLTLFIATAAPAHAADAGTGPMTAETCTAARHELNAMAALFQQGETLDHQQLVQALQPHLEGLLANRPTVPALRTQASNLLGDIKDSMDILHGAVKPAIHQLARQRLEQDHQQYGVLLETAGCPADAAAH